MLILDKLINPPKEYRPIPFWSWNEKLDVNETKRQIDLMDKIGLGGYFMHARGGLQTEYMGEEWFENVDLSVEEGIKRGMGAWAYDENGWPSGFGNGLVNGLGIEYQQKYLRYEQGLKNNEFTICNKDGVHFYYDVNPFYVDTLDKKVTKEFIDKIYQHYYDRYKGQMPGIFTDEPQISRDGIPWSFILPEEYKKAYNEDLLDHLIELFKPIRNYEKTRFQFWKLITKLFSENFTKQIYDWCEEHGFKLTGHMVHEESFINQITTNGAVMPNYEYFHMPSIDWLGRFIMPPLIQLQLCSVANQLGKKHIMTETFALCGHNVSFQELRWILEWQMARGVNLFCSHLEGYSLRGIRKRDYPPALFYQQPWWEEYKIFIESMTRIGVLLADGKVAHDTLLIHPQSSAWTYFDNDKNEGLEEFNDYFNDIISKLEQKHILFHLGDETIMEKHARVEGKTIVIGTQVYNNIIIPTHKVLFESTNKLLDEFRAIGGLITTSIAINENPVIDNPNITYNKRIFDDFDMHYFVNCTKEEQPSKIYVGNEKLNLLTGLFEPFFGDYTFSPMDSIVIIDKKNKKEYIKAEEVKLKPLAIDGLWDIEQNDLNAITLDYCDYYFDDELIEKNGYVLSIQNRACELKRKVNIKKVFTLEIEVIPKEIFLVCETPNIFTTMVNDKVIDKKDCGYYIDSSFRKINIAKYLHIGTNKIVLETDFVQSYQVYENIEKSKVFESEKNKLTYDMEIESIYIVGDFSVKTEGKINKLNKNTIRYDGNFIISEKQPKVKLQNLETQGFPFFAGKISLSKLFNLDNINYKLKFNMTGINAVSLKVNGVDGGTIIFSPLEFDLSKLLVIGENKIELTLTNNLHNLLGPHHLKEGESLNAGPHSFFKEPCIWNFNPSEIWDDRYCFVETSIIGVSE